MPNILNRLKSKKAMRSGRASSTLSGQLTLPPIFQNLKTVIQDLKLKIKEKRPGVIIPPETTSLTSPGSLQVDHERVLPQKIVNSRLSIDVDR